MEQNALALEYEAEYGRTNWDRGLSNVINNPNASSVVRVFGPGFSIPFFRR
jgi:hypothetical protein